MPGSPLSRTSVPGPRAPRFEHGQLLLAADERGRTGEIGHAAHAPFRRLHPYDCTLTVWQRRPDGGYVESHHGGDVAVELAARPGVGIDLGAVFG